MLRRIGVAMVFGLLAGGPLFGQDWAKKMFQATDHDFGTVARGAKAEFDFPLSNIYLEDVHIVSARSSCGCTSPSVVKPDLKTYEKGAIRATFNTRAFLGQRGATLTVTLDKPFPAEIQLHVKGYIRSDIVFEPGSVQLGEVDQGSAVERKVAVTYAGRSDWKVLEIKSSNPNLSAEAVETARSAGQVSYELAVRLSPNASAGYLNDQLTLLTNDGQSTQIPLLVEGRVLSGVSVSPASLFMGVVQPGQKVTKPLVVKSKKPFRIISITCDDQSFEFGKETDSSSKALHVIPVTFLAGTNAGKVTKTIRIETDLGERTPELAAYAVVTP
jgi:hypothetical protein